MKAGRHTAALSGAAAALLLAARALAGEIPAGDRRSGFDFMGAETQAMQRDDDANPGMLWVREGEALWSRKAGARAESCADCHGEAKTSMRGVATRYPAFDENLGRAVTLEERVNLCRAERQGAPALRLESPDLLGITAFVAHQSRGLPITVGDDPRLQPTIAEGRRLYEMRQGQLNLSCAGCHDDHWGKRLAGNPVPQAHPTGYPLYRLEWQSVGSLARRLRNCLVGMRAEPLPPNSPEQVALEAFLAARAQGMPMETPAVRP